METDLQPAPAVAAQQSPVAEEGAMPRSPPVSPVVTFALASPNAAASTSAEAEAVVAPTTPRDDEASLQDALTSVGPSTPRDGGSPQPQSPAAFTDNERDAVVPPIAVSVAEAEAVVSASPVVNYDMSPALGPSTAEPPSPGTPQHFLSSPGTPHLLATPTEDGTQEEVDKEQSPQASVASKLVSSKRMSAVHSPENDTENDEDLLHSDDDNLGTPLGIGGMGFHDYEEEFASHRFIGPSIADDDLSVRALHDIRRVFIHAKPPKFASDVACKTARFPVRRSSSAAIGNFFGGAGSRSHSVEVQTDQQMPPLNTFEVTFNEEDLGFRTRTSVTEVAGLAIQVADVDRDGAAYRAGVVSGDDLVSINHLPLATHMTSEQVQELLHSVAAPRTIVFARPFHDLPELPRSKSTSSDEGARNASMARLSSAFSYGSSLLGSALMRKKPAVHQGVSCDGCGVDPVVGHLWSCSVCPHYHLCSECYDLGTHGMENTDAMQMLNEALVQDKLQKSCKQFTAEFLLSLRRDVCKNRPDKFEYLGAWIADIVNGTPANKITVRGIEIPQLQPEGRQRFVSKLMRLVSNRTDIEVNIEWLLDDSIRASVDVEDLASVDTQSEPEKLRIWISDKKTRTASPFT